MAPKRTLKKRRLRGAGSACSGSRCRSSASVAPASNSMDRKLNTLIRGTDDLEKRTKGIETSPVLNSIDSLEDLETFEKTHLEALSEMKISITTYMHDITFMKRQIGREEGKITRIIEPLHEEIKGLVRKGDPKLNAIIRVKSTTKVHYEKQKSMFTKMITILERLLIQLEALKAKIAQLTDALKERIKSKRAALQGSRSASHRSASHRSASHRSASHRSASHRSASHRPSVHNSPVLNSISSSGTGL